MGALDLFDNDEYYPGSSRKIGSPLGARQATINEAGWDANPQLHRVPGKAEPLEFFGTSDLAKALGRKPVTIRKWESLGIIPNPPFTRPSEDPRGRRRLYTRAHIEGMVQIAKDEGVLYGYNVKIRTTRFPERVRDLFLQLKAAK